MSSYESPEDATAQNDAWRQFVQSVHDGDALDYESHWTAYQEIFANRKAEDGPPIVWMPNEERLDRANISASMNLLGVDSYQDFHRWTVENRADFWHHALEQIGVVFKKPPTDILDLSDGVAQPRWLVGAQLNSTDSCFTHDPDAPAIVSGAEGGGELSVVTYGELEKLVNRVACGLVEHGISQGTAIAIYMPMTVACVVAYLGIIRAGCQVVSIADSFSATEVQTRMRIAGAEHIVTVDEYVRAGKTITMYDKVLEAGVPNAIVIPSDNSVDQLRDSDVLWEDLLSDSDVFESIACDPYDGSNILFSSGTTGEPKAILWSHLTPLKCAMDGFYHQDIHEGDVVAWPTNIGWMMGPWLIYASLMNCATIALYEGAPLGPGFARFIENAGVTMLGVIPSLVRVWRTSGAIEGTDWSSIRTFSSTGEPSNRYDYLWLMSQAGYRAPVVEYLGGTEIGGGHLTGTVVQPASPSTFTTPGLGVDFVILDENHQPIEDGNAGELFLIPPSIGLSQVLLNREHDDVYFKDCPCAPNGDVLRRHGDETLKLHGGFYRAMGRADDTMNLGGIKISSLELERVVDTHEAVYESAAIGVQVEGEGAEQLVLFVKPNREIDSDTLQQGLRKMIAAQLNPLFKISDLVFSDDLPRTASNKIMRRELRAQYNA